MEVRPMLDALNDVSAHTGFRDDEARLAAVRRRDAAADGVFLYSVATTGVYCRPSCAAYGIHTFDWAADWATRAKPAAMAANCAHPARMVLGPGGL